MAPKSRDYSYRPPKKVRTGALCAALSLRAREKAWVIVDTFTLQSPKTKATLELLTKRLKLGERPGGGRAEEHVAPPDGQEPGRLRRAPPRG